MRLLAESSISFRKLASTISRKYSLWSRESTTIPEKNFDRKRATITII
jgi:hypothetical protein